MYVCLCAGVTNDTVSAVILAGAGTCNQVADACGAGSECGRCRLTIRSIIESTTSSVATRRRGSDR